MASAADLFCNASSTPRYRMQTTHHQGDTRALPLHIVLNASSGSEKAEDAHALIAGALDEAGRAHHIQMVRRGSEIPAAAKRAAALAKKENGAVIAAGGDGTINAVAQAAHDIDCPMGVVPQGTFNYFSRTHGIPLDTAEAARALVTARIQPVQVGDVNGKIFLVNASLGLYPELLEDREQFKSRFGRNRGVALVSALHTILREHRQLRLRIQSAGGAARNVRTSTLFVGNNRLQLQQVGLPEARAIEHGRVAGVMLKPASNLALVWLLVRGAMGTLGEDERVQSFEFEHMTVSRALSYGGRRAKVAVDGEVLWLQTPLQFGVSPRPLQLLMPANATASRL